MNMVTDFTSLIILAFVCHSLTVIAKSPHHPPPHVLNSLYHPPRLPTISSASFVILPALLLFTILLPSTPNINPLPTILTNVLPLLNNQPPPLRIQLRVLQVLQRSTTSRAPATRILTPYTTAVWMRGPLCVDVGLHFEIGARFTVGFAFKFGRDVGGRVDGGEVAAGVAG
jgi:hypothetical protein